MAANLNSILKVKINDQWTDILALRGYSIELLDIIPITESGRTGYEIHIYDERKAKEDPEYEYDSFKLWNGVDGQDGQDGAPGRDGANGQGTVNSVDGIEAPSGEHDVPLKAVSYGRSQSLSSDEKAQARTNINAQIKGDYQPKGNYVLSPILKNTNEFLKYDGNDQWSTSTVSVLPESTDIGILVKSNSSMNSLSWMPAITNVEIDGIFSN